MYWPWVGDGPRGSAHAGPALGSPTHACLPRLPPYLVVVDEVEVLQGGNDILLLDAGDFTDLAVGGQRSGPLEAFTSAPSPQEPQA